ncbi:MAG TPA: efflux RND transporter permease subunit, partial [Candidatus Hydrogenedentes bacterium]|nr:efflux RND transporter permease subunit [Candidatus Hydrogenedentota bacterium]
MKTLERWEPENPEFWETTGKRVAWRTLIITTATLTLSFATWFAMSAIVVRLPHIGFAFSQRQLFWLAAMPGLAGGTLRIVHTFLIPIYGTRNVITAATLIKGTKVGEVYEQQKVYEVVVWGHQALRTDLDSLRMVPIETPAGGHVPLGDVADISIVPAPNEIKRE